MYMKVHRYININTKVFICERVHEQACVHVCLHINAHYCLCTFNTCCLCLCARSRGCSEDGWRGLASFINREARHRPPVRVLAWEFGPFPVSQSHLKPSCDVTMTLLPQQKAEIHVHFLTRTSRNPISAGHLPSNSSDNLCPLPAEYGDRKPELNELSSFSMLPIRTRGNTDLRA